MIPHLKSLNIVFFGTGNFAAHHLYLLLNCSIHKIIIVFTQEKQSLTKKKPLSSIIKISQIYNLLYFQSYSLSMLDIANIIDTMDIDIIIVVSYGLILPKQILNIPKLGCINIHGSLLPRWRGPAPIARALEYGDNITGISIIEMDSGIDTGNILYSKICKISKNDTSYTLSKKLAFIGSIGLLKTIEKIILGTCNSKPQNLFHSTYANKLSKKEARINWKNSAIELERRIRAFNPWPISYFQIKNQYIKIWNAEIYNNSIHLFHKKYHNSISDFPAGMILKFNNHGIYVSTGSGIIILTILQIPGKKKMVAKELLNGYKSWFPIYSMLE